MHYYMCICTGHIYNFTFSLAWASAHVRIDIVHVCIAVCWQTPAYENQTFYR